MRFIDSRFQIPDSRFQIPDSRFQIPDSRFQIPDSGALKYRLEGNRRQFNHR
ncbi:MAG: hypothetical protein IPN69_17445 [Acidobacteria bacterium]|nr:hypothetical protein [Acidobacteriota bacterium]